MFGKLLKKSVAIIIMVSLFITTFIYVLPISAATTHNVYYSAGDVDNIVGSSTFTLAVTEGSNFEFSDSSRFSRKGYKLASWYVENTGQTVGTSQTYRMPSYDLYVTANWKPETYNIGFAGMGGKTSLGDSNVYIPAEYGTLMTLPENPFTKDGYTFSGWKYNGVIYNEGDEFEIPAVISGLKIVISAVWTKEVEVTTTAATTVTTTTTTTTTTAATTTTTSLMPGQVLKTLELGYDFNSNSEIIKKYFYSFIDSNDKIDRLVFNFSSDYDRIGTVSLAFFSTLTSNDNYQKDFIETINGNEFSVDFGDMDTCNLLGYAKSFQVACWYSETYPLTLDSVVAVVREPEMTTTTEITTITTTTTETTTVTTTTTTAPSTTTTNTNTTEAITTSSSSKNTLNNSTSSSKVVYLNNTISRGGEMSIIDLWELTNGQSIESMEFTFRTDNDQIGNYNIGMFVNLANNGSLQQNFNGNSLDNTFTEIIEITDKSKNTADQYSKVNLGYWWGDNETIILDSVKINFSKSEDIKGDFNNNGIIDSEDVYIIKNLMVGNEIDNIFLSLENGDINDDGCLNVFDCIVLQRMVK